jgi:rhamnosyl/mannosyltransferase
VLPSLDKSEAFGLVLEEALSSGIPCVSSNLAGVKTLIECTNGGELAEPGNVESLHKALVAVIARKKSDPTWGAHIRARAITLFSQKTNIALLYEIYKRIVDHSKN